MARKVILDRYYTFTPSTRTIVIPRAVPKERLILITDVTTNVVIYNFSDPNLLSTSYTIATDSSGNTTTTIVLNYNTAALSSTDSLQIIIDEYDEKFSPSETYLDPVNKLRVSQPQSLIDTDFEYSTQATKWEPLALLNNQPFAYYYQTTPLTITDIQATQGSRSYVANTNANLAVGTPISVLDTLYGGADGTYIIDSSNGTNFTYTGKFYYPGTSGTVYSNNVTAIYQGYQYSFAPISLSAVSNTSNAISITTTQPHNLALGNEIALVGTTATSGAPNGSWVVSTIANSTNFIVYTNATPGGAVTTTTALAGNVSTGNVIINTITSTANIAAGMIAANATYFTAAPPTIVTAVINSTAVSVSQPPLASATNATINFGAVVYPRPMGSTLHRPFSGGIRFSTNSPSHNQQYIRQTRRYFRYQSGKGIQMSTGTTLKPNMFIDQLTSSGNTVTVYTKDPHNITNGATVNIANTNETGYSGTWTVANVINPYAFTYVSNSAPTVTTASGNYNASVAGWYGGSTRIGIFDNMNGMFWEFDGQTLYAVRRNSVYQLAGYVSVTPGSATVTANTSLSTGVSTAFSKQLAVNDFIVIKGMSYRVTNILSDTTMTISPAYRGTASSPNAIITRTVDNRTPQSAFNIDRLDGTGPSGYNIDLTKNQMFYIDYSWYGAGFIRFGVRGPDGNVIYCHKVINNNVNYQAYMRSGNLPGRYETNTFSKITNITSSVATGDTTINVANTVGWPNTGIAWIRTPTTSEFVNYTAKTNTSLTVARTLAGASAVTTSTTNNSPVVVVSSNSNIQVGQYVIGTGVPPAAFVTNVVGTNVTLSVATTNTNASAALTFAPMGATAAQTFSYSATAPVNVELHAPSYASEINHWGTSAIMDGQFTVDKAYVFTKGMTTSTTVPTGNTYAIMSFRISPSASQSQPGNALGVREIVNRMQLIPYELDMVTPASMLVSVYLNTPINLLNQTWTNVGGSSLSQYVFHNANTIVTGGEAIFGFYLNSSGGNNVTVTQQDMTFIRDLGTSILSGGTATAGYGIYPDGPDVLTIAVTNLTAGANTVSGRFSWTEAQA